MQLKIFGIGIAELRDLRSTIHRLFSGKTPEEISYEKWCAENRDKSLDELIDRLKEDIRKEKRG